MTRSKILIIKISIGIILINIITILSYVSITQYKKIKRQESALLTIEMSFDDTDNIKVKYDFIDKRKAIYIESLCKECNVDADRAFAHLMQENPTFDEFAMNRDNANGSVDLGLFMLNDKYLWTDFIPRYWIEGVEFDPFNWKHNAYIAIHHMSWLQEKLKVEDDVIMAYNCGISAVMNEDIPPATKVYLAKVKNNLFLLKNIENGKAENK